MMISIAYAQHTAGGRYLAMGNTGAALQGIHSLTANQAGLTGLQRPVAGILYQHHFFDTDLNSQAIMLAVPTRLGVFGLLADRYALSGAFSETKAGFSYGRLFGRHLAVAMAFNYHQLRIPNYGGSQAFSVDVGVQYRVSPRFRAGLHYANPGKLGYGADAFSVVPSILRGGVAYDFADVVSVSADIANFFDDRLDPRLGLEYRLVPWLCFRGGLSFEPMKQYAGFGVEWEQLVFDFSASFHARLGMSPQFALAYAF